MTQQSGAARLEEIRRTLEKFRAKYGLHRSVTLSAEELDFLIALASRAVEAEAELAGAMPYFSGAGRFTGMEAVLRGSDDD